MKTTTGREPCFLLEGPGRSRRRQGQERSEITGHARTFPELGETFRGVRKGPEKGSIFSTPERLGGSKSAASSSHRGPGLTWREESPPITEGTSPLHTQTDDLTWSRGVPHIPHHILHHILLTPSSLSSSSFPVPRFFRSSSTPLLPPFQKR